MDNIINIILSVMLLFIYLIELISNKKRTKKDYIIFIVISILIIYLILSYLHKLTIFLRIFLISLFVIFIVMLYKNNGCYKEGIFTTEYGDEFYIKSYIGGFLRKRYSEIYDSSSNYIIEISIGYYELTEKYIVGICNNSDLKAYKIKREIIYSRGKEFKVFDISKTNEYPELVEELNKYLTDKDKIYIQKQIKN